MSLYLDASVIVPTLVREPSAAAVERLVERQTERPIVGDLAAIEVSSAISRLVRMGQISVHAAATILADFDVWRGAMGAAGRVEAADFRAADAIVRRFELGLRGLDALHLAACLRGGHTLATLDRRLANAAATLGLATAVPA